MNESSVMEESGVRNDVLEATNLGQQGNDDDYSKAMPSSITIVVVFMRMTGIVYCKPCIINKQTMLQYWIELVYCTLCNIFRLFLVVMTIVHCFYRDNEGGIFDVIMLNATPIIYRTWCLGNALAIYRACWGTLQEFLVKWCEIKQARYHGILDSSEMRQSSCILKEIQNSVKPSRQIYSLLVVIMASLFIIIVNMMITMHMYSYWQTLLDNINFSQMNQILLLIILVISQLLSLCGNLVPSLLMYSFCVVAHCEFKILNMSLQLLGQMQSVSVDQLKSYQLWHQ